MKSMTAEMKAHLAQEVTTLATCWKATLTNGAVYGFTDHSRDINFGGTLFRYSTGFSPTAVETSSMLNVDNMDVEAILDSDMIKEEDLMAGLWDYAYVEIFWVNWNDLGMGSVELKTGTIGQVTVRRTSFTAEVRGLTQNYQNNIIEITSPMCRARLGDNRCKVDLAALTMSSAVETASTSRRSFTDPNLTAPGPAVSVAIVDVSRAAQAVVSTDVPHGFIKGQQIFISGVEGVVQLGSVDENGDMQQGTGNGINGYSYGIDNVTEDTFTIPVDTRLGSTNPASGPAYADVYSDYAGGGVAAPGGQSAYYDYGLVTFKTGLNAGLSMEVKSYVPGYVELQLPFPYPIAPNDEYEIQPGCGKRLVEDCLEKFNNVVNFRGEPWLPGMDKATTYASHGSAIADGTAVDIGGTGGGVGGGIPGGGGTSGGGVVEPEPPTGWTESTVPGEGWKQVSTNVWMPYTIAITDAQIEMGDVWYATGNPSSPWTTDSTAGTLSHITVRRIYTAPGHPYTAGRVLDTMGIYEHRKIWNSTLGAQKMLTIHEVGGYNSSYQDVQRMVYTHQVRRVTTNTFEFWDVIPLSSQDDLDAYLNMPVEWTSVDKAISDSSAAAWTDVGTSFDKNNIQYPMSYGGTVINAGVEEVQYPLSGATVVDVSASNLYDDPGLNTPDTSTTVSVTSIVPENGMARVTAPGHTFQNGDAVKIKDVVGVNLRTHAFTNSGGAYIHFNGLTWLVSGVTSDSFLINFDASHDFDPSTLKYAYYTAYSHGGTAARVTGRTRHLITEWHVECDSSVLYDFLAMYPTLTPNTDPYWPKTLVYKSVFTAAGHGLVTDDMPWMAGDGDPDAMDGYAVGGMTIGQRPYNAQLPANFPDHVKYKGQLVTEFTTNTFTVHNYRVVHSQAEADTLAAQLTALGADYTGNVYVTKGMKMAFNDY